MIFGVGCTSWFIATNIFCTDYTSWLTTSDLWYVVNQLTDNHSDPNCTNWQSFHVIVCIKEYPVVCIECRLSSLLISRIARCWMDLVTDNRINAWPSSLTAIVAWTSWLTAVLGWNNRLKATVAWTSWLTTMVIPALNYQVTVHFPSPSYNYYNYFFQGNHWMLVSAVKYKNGMSLFLYGLVG